MRNLVRLDELKIAIPSLLLGGLFGWFIVNRFLIGWLDVYIANWIFTNFK
jgi:hypothetical protein